MADLPVLKTQRYRKEKRAKGGDRLIAEAFFVPGPNAETYSAGPDKFICKAGPGLGPIPREGRWYDVTDYLLRRVRAGDAAEGIPPVEKKPAKATVTANKGDKK